MRLSVPCNFDEELIQGLDGYPVYEVFGKVSADFAGGGRPSWYLPRAGRADVERFVACAHAAGIEFNYLLNAMCMGNTELTREGQRNLRETLDWVCEIGCDSVTVANLLLLQLIKRCYPGIKVRISAHRFTDSPRKARFWEEHGADCIVLNETASHREFELLAAIRESVSCDLSLIVNNSCRQDCAIAGTHACALNHASQHQRGRRQAFPLDYHILFCLHYRLAHPVNYIRANWIRPEDLHHYEAIGYHNFKIVERNTPTPVLLQRVHAYANRHFDGNLFDLILPFQYPESAYTTRASRDAYSVRRAFAHFFAPRQVNVTRIPRLARLAKRMGLLYPRLGDAPLRLDNRKLDGFIDRFLSRSCIDVDCEKCRYCHKVAAQTVEIDPQYRDEVMAAFDELFEDMNTGKFWEPSHREIATGLREVGRAARSIVERFVSH
jgi:collagenase-like PrtC family protease